MTNTKLDDTFNDELMAIENWFRVLSDPERTACLYSLLKGTTPLQIRFFITVLQQMAAKDVQIDPLSHSMRMSPGLGLGLKLEEKVLADPWFTERKLFPNIDFWTAIC